MYKLKIYFVIFVIALFPKAGIALDVNQYPALQNLINLMTTKDGYPQDELITVLQSASIDQKTLELMDRQYESLPWYKYRALFINDNRIEMGVKFWNTYELILDRAEQVFGVPVAVIVALIGVETHYGTRIGDKSVLNSLVTLSAAYPRRSEFFSNELRTFLNTTRKENIDPGSVVGSFAGAIGIPQFMPTSYEAYAVDFNGNNQRDLVNETDDAIGSVGNYLKVHGWDRSQKIYAQVTSPLSESNKNFVGKKAKLIHNTSGLVDAGIDFNVAGASAKSALIRFKQESTEKYIVGFQNFYSITRYNPSVNYALAVTELSEAIKAKRKQ